MLSQLFDLNAPAAAVVLAAALVAGAYLFYRNSQLQTAIGQRANRDEVARLAEQRLQEMFDISPTGLLVTRLSDGQVLYVNPKLAALIGGTPQELVGRPAPNYYAHQTDREQLVSLLAKNGSVQDYELAIRRPDGERIWASFSANIHRYGGEEAIFASIIDISLRKDSESILIDATRTFRDLLESAPTAIIIAESASSQIIFANLHAANLLGLAQDELIGRAAQSLYRRPEQRQELVDALQQGKIIQDVELEFQRFDGQPLWMRVSARLTPYEGRQAVISTWEDITDRRQTEQRLRTSEKNHRLALEAAPFPLFIASAADHSLLLINRRAVQALFIGDQHKLDDALADDFMDAAVRAEVTQMLSGGEEITDREALVRPRTGARFWALVSARKIDFEGQPAFIFSFTDISEHKRNEREIAESRTTLRSMINASPIWMAMFDRSGYYLLVNRPFEVLIGRSAAKIEGRHYTEVLPAPLATRHATLINRCIEGEVVEFEGALDSEEFNPLATESVTTNVHGKYSPVIGKDGTVSGGVLAMIDITERHKAEEKLKAQFAEIHKLHQRLQEQVVRDPLTGLFNRRYLDETLDRELARARREGYPICVIMIDIDHFKRLNDTYGHQAGDEVLKALARLLTESMREGDMPCRYGGEEFTLVLPNATAPIARERAEEWRMRFEALATQFGRFELTSTISLGIAAYPEHGKTRDELIQAADEALYASKRAGRNTSRIHSTAEPSPEIPA